MVNGSGWAGWRGGSPFWPFCSLRIDKQFMAPRGSEVERHFCDGVAIGKVPVLLFTGSNPCSHKQP